MNYVRRFRPSLDPLEERRMFDASVPTLWGIDEDDGQLFSIADHTRIAAGIAAAGFVDYGRLKYDRSGFGELREIGNDIEAMALDSDGTMYFALNDDVRLTGQPTLKAPVLFRFNVFSATTAGPNVATVIGRIPLEDFDPDDGDNVSGLAFDPLSGDLLAMHRVDGDKEVDRLLVIDRFDAAVLADLGPVQGGPLGAKSERGEEIEFDTSGNLYSTDDLDDDLYQISTVAANVISITDADERGGTGLSRSPKVEGMAYIEATGNILAFDDKNDSFVILTPGDGGNLAAGKIKGLTDVEGLEFLRQFNECDECCFDECAGFQEPRQAGLREAPQAKGDDAPKSDASVASTAKLSPRRYLGIAEQSTSDNSSSSSVSPINETPRNVATAVVVSSPSTRGVVKTDQATIQAFVRRLHRAHVRSNVEATLTRELLEDLTRAHRV